MAQITPTEEQFSILESFMENDDLVVEAGAGTGKTSTLKLLAGNAEGRRGLYFAYNRAIADDAKSSFPANVTCKTAHSLAFGAVGRQYQHRLNGPRVPGHEAARILGLSLPVAISDDGSQVIQAVQVARLAGQAVRNYCYSADAELGGWHVPIAPGLEDRAQVVREIVLPVAKKVWADVTSMEGRLKFEHDHYLKIWQLSQPRLPYDFVMLDEAQDANPAVADIVERQVHAQRILVGDRSQSIYGWRGARDAMTGFRGTRRQLSQSFRFGQAIAEEANKWLTLLHAPLRLRGYERIISTVQKDVPNPDAILCRTNAEALAQVMLGHRVGKRVALVGGGQDIRSLAEAAISLKAGIGTSHPELFAFKTWGELQEYVENDEAGADLKVFVRLVDSHGPETIIDAVDRLSDERFAEVVATTAHRAKGREWKSVQIAGDFVEPSTITEDPRAEFMLAYVSVTRAQHALGRGALEWVDGRLAPMEVVA